MQVSEKNFDLKQLVDLTKRIRHSWHRWATESWTSGKRTWNDKRNRYCEKDNVRKFNPIVNYVIVSIADWVQIGDSANSIFLLQKWRVHMLLPMHPLVLLSEEYMNSSTWFSRYLFLVKRLNILYLYPLCSLIEYGSHALYTMKTSCLLFKW